MKPIGHFHCEQTNPYEAPRQGVLQNQSTDSSGYIELLSGQNFEQALDGLQEFSHLWILFLFHHNSSWKPKVLPPRGSSKKIGVFATRSPYRPNPIGISCVKLKKIEGRKIFVTDFDLLDGTPVLDIKPYLAYADSFPEANEGWIRSQKFDVQLSSAAQEQIQFLQDHKISQLLPFLQIQLEVEPTNSRKKRILSAPEKYPDHFHVLAYRTWRALFFVEENTVEIVQIFSGYSTEDLKTPRDPYQDKDLHREFILRFPNSAN